MAINYIQQGIDYGNAYRQRIAAEQQQMANQLAASKQSTNATYDSNAAQAYINRIRQENALNEQLRARGINGGASETAMTRIMNNYALGQSNNNAARGTAIGQLQNTYDTNIATMNSDMERAIADYQAEMAQKQAEYEQEQNDKLLEQYSATLERFTSAKSVKKAISKLDPNDPNYQQKKWLLQLRKAQLGGGSGGSGTGKKSSSKKSSKASSAYTSAAKSSGSSKKSSSKKSSTKKTSTKKSSGKGSSGKKTSKKKNTTFVMSPSAYVQKAKKSKKKK